MKKQSNRSNNFFYKAFTMAPLLLFIKTPILNRYATKWYTKLGVRGTSFRISPKINLVGSYHFLNLDKNAEINTGCFLLAKDYINIGENSTLAYQVTILTSSNPNGPFNKLSKVYAKQTKPVSIGRNSWIGAKATILPGVNIGSFCIVAAGSVVNKDIPDYTVVAGVPAKPIKKLNPEDFD